MGCCGLRCCYSRSRGEGDKEPLSKPKYSWDRDTDRPDRSLLIVADQEGGVVGRLPGQLNGTQFKISNCRDAVVLVLDHMDSVIVDKCERCKIVLGPSRGSVFLRNCTNCVVVVACQQFRSRDCVHCHIFLHCNSQPVVESCTTMKFSCFQCYYPQLKAQFGSAKLSVFNNKWSAVHDFTKDLEGSNWSVVLDDAPNIEVTEGEFGQVGLNFSREQSVVPHTTGLGQKALGEACLVTFFSQDDLEETALAFVGRIQGKAQLVVARQATLNSHQAGSLFSERTKLAALASKGMCILLEVSGQDCTAECQQESEEAPEDLVYVSPDPQQGQTDTEALTSYINIGVNM